MPRIRRPPRLRPICSRAALLAAGVLLTGAAGAPAAAAPLPEMVVQDDAALLHRPAETVANTLDRLAAFGVDRVRLTAGWSVLTRGADDRVAPAGFDAADPAAYEQARWTALDTAVRLARARGLKVLIDIGFWAPVWATSDTAGPRARTSVDPEAYRDFALAVTRRYDGSFVPPAVPPQTPAPAPAPDDAVFGAIFGGGPGTDGTSTTPGAPLPAVDEVALWNEPNHPALLLPQWRTARTAPTSPDVYRRMVLAAYPAVKQLHPGLVVLIGNTSSTGGTPGEGPVAPLRFIRQLACVDRHLRPLRTGACAAFTMLPGDGWAHHPYTAGQAPTKTSVGSHADDARIGDLPRLAALLDALAARGRIAPADRQIHLTEFGYETHDIGRRKGLTQRRQAHWLTWAEYLADRIPTVVATAQFLLADTLPATTRVSDSTARPFGQFYSGLLDGEGHDKLAVRSFTVGLFAGRRADGRLLLWVRLRGGTGRRRVRIQRRARDNSWVTIPSRPGTGGPAVDAFTTGARSAGSRIASAAAGDGGSGSAYRLLVEHGATTVTGLPTPVEPDAG